MYTYPIYFTPTQPARPNPPPFSHPRPEYPYYGYRPDTVPQIIYPQRVSAPVPLFAPQVPVFVQPVIRYPAWQAPSPTPLPIPAGTPSEVRYEIVGGVLTPVRHFQYNSPAEAGRGYSPHGLDTGSLPPGWGMTPPEAPAVRDPAPASSQPDAQLDAGTGGDTSRRPTDNPSPPPDTPSASSTNDPTPNSGSLSANAPPRPPRPTVEDEPQSRNVDQASGASSGDTPKKEGQGASGSGANNNG